MKSKSILKVEEFGTEYYMSEKALRRYLRCTYLIVDWEGRILYKGTDPKTCIKKMSEQAYGNQFIIKSGIKEVPRSIRITRIPFYPKWKD